MCNFSSNEDTIHNLCRCCMLQTKKTQQGSFDDNLLDVYTKITSRKLQDWNNMPKVICQRCSAQLTTINDFILKCVDVDEKFNNIAQAILTLSNENEINLSSLKVEGEVIEVIEVHVLDDEELEINSADIKDEINVSVDDWKDSSSFLEATEVNTTLNKTEENKTLQENAFKRPQRTNKRKKLNDEVEDPPKKPRYKNKRIYLSPATCFTCKMKFKRGAPGKARQELEEHYKASEGCKPQEFKCPHCPRTCRKKSDLELHMDVHSTDLKYKCKECELCFKQESSLIRHFNNKHNANAEPSLCEFCPKSYLNLRNLQAHLQQCHPEKLNIICNLCHKKCINERGLQRHIAAIHKDKKKVENKQEITCNLCPKKFKNTVGLHLHMRCVHLDGTKIYYNCNLCPRKFLNELCLKRHMDKNHPNGEADTKSVCIKCTFCPKMYNSVKYLKCHMRKIHSYVDSTQKTSTKIKKRYDLFKLCNICGIKVRSIVFQLHLNKHKGIRPFECNTCSKKFYTKAELKMHGNIHLSIKPFKCNQCTAAFSVSSSLYRHYRTHTGEKPFECPHCHKCFGRRQHLVQHSRIHTGERPFECPHCDETFTFLSTLSLHKKTHIKNEFVTDKQN